MGQIDYEVKDHVATIVLNNPTKLNAVDKQMCEGLVAAYDDIIADDDVRVAIITGSGEKAFSSGASITGYMESGVIGQNAEERREPIPKPERIYKPFIAAIEGYCVGGGFTLALYCDLRVVTTASKVGPTSLKRGVVNGATIATLMTRSIGLSNAMELILMSKVVEGSEAYRIGFAQRLVEPGHALDEAMEMARVIASFSPDAVQGTKRVGYDNLELSLNDALKWELEVTERSFKTVDALEGFQSFLEKREARFGQESSLDQLGFEEFWPEGVAPTWRTVNDDR
jgi:enoyl-CoA hydratase/carnithine racemase